MTKDEALNAICDIPINDRAEAIYRATVEGVAGHKQNGGYGFRMSQIARAYNITNPDRNDSKITGRYKRLGVPYEVICDIVERYPNGIANDSPSFDELIYEYVDDGEDYENRTINNQLDGTRTTSGSGSDSPISVTALFIAFVIIKFVIGLGWIWSIVLSLIVASFVEFYIDTKLRK